MDLMSESLAQKSDNKIRKVAKFTLITDGILPKLWNSPADLRSASFQNLVIFHSTLSELAGWLNTFPRVPISAFLC
jgi:hypothetical protein